jgi:hypothetical protein
MIYQSDMERLCMLNDVKFALRLRPELRDAAKALTRLSFVETATGSLSFNSINEALNSLILKGLPGVLDLVEAELADQRVALPIWEGITRFFLDNPAATEARPFNFEEGSVERRTLESMIVPVESDDLEASDDEEVPYSGPMPEVGLLNLEFAMAPTHMPRPGAARGLALVQRRIWELTAAKGAIQRVSQRPQ